MSLGWIWTCLGLFSPTFSDLYLRYIFPVSTEDTHRHMDKHLYFINIDEKSESQEHLDLPWSIFIKIFKHLRAVDFASHLWQTQVQTFFFFQYRLKQNKNGILKSFWAFLQFEALNVVYLQQFKLFLKLHYTKCMCYLISISLISYSYIYA